MVMNLSLNKLPWYGQVGVFVAIGAGLIAAFWNFHAQAKGASIAERETRLATIRAEIDKGLATARRLPEFRKEVAELEAQLERLKSVLPEEKDAADLLRRIQGMATQSNLTIRGFTPRAVTTKKLHAEWPITLQLDGSYHNLGGFLERVSKFPRIINVNGITIKARDKQTEASTISTECTAMTFVLTDASTGKPAAAKPGTPKTK
jgi:type IV pilus assembly protein PilO